MIHNSTTVTVLPGRPELRPTLPYEAWKPIHNPVRDQIEAELRGRGASLAEIDAANHRYMVEHPYYEGVMASEGAAEHASTSYRFSVQRGANNTLLAGYPPDDMHPVREIIRVPYHELVLLVDDTALYVMTEQEFSAQL